MVKKITVENYKSLQHFELELGQVNVLIGANGCGKTNILESIAVAGAAAANKLDREVLVPRGVRWTEPESIKSGFAKENEAKEITITVDLQGKKPVQFVLSTSEDNKLELHFLGISSSAELDDKLAKLLQQKELDMPSINDYINRIAAERTAQLNGLSSFLIYCPENTALRNFESEGQIEPLGVKGEGLFKHLIYLSEHHPPLFETIRKHLQFIDWYDDFEIPSNLQFTEKRLRIKDRFLEDGLAYFDQRSANEGFLYLLFYLVLFVSPKTPSFFAIDNIDNSLNPKLCTKLMSLICELAKENNKQVILTTHNPAILDGLDLKEDEQRLLMVYRNADGHTKAKRFLKKETKEGEELIPMSERFLRGYIGGLPKNF